MSCLKNKIAGQTEKLKKKCKIHTPILSKRQIWENEKKNCKTIKFPQFFDLLEMNQMIL